MYLVKTILCYFYLCASCLTVLVLILFVFQLVSTKPYIRKRAVLLMYKIFLKVLRTSERSSCVFFLATSNGRRLHFYDRLLRQVLCTCLQSKTEVCHYFDGIWCTISLLSCCQGYRCRWKHSIIFQGPRLVWIFIFNY